jgi:hypothetical protein
VSNSVVDLATPGRWREVVDVRKTPAPGAPAALRRPLTIPASRRSGPIKACYGAPVGASWRWTFHPFFRYEPFGPENPSNESGRGQEACSILHGFTRWHHADTRSEIFDAVRLAPLPEQPLPRVW